MIKTRLHLQRLIRLAEHLHTESIIRNFSETEVLFFDSGTKLYFFREGAYLVHPSIELQLEHLFPHHFTLNFKGITNYIPKPGTAATLMLGYFFGLNVDEYLNLFVSGRQKPDLYNSIILAPNAGPEVYAENIFRFLDSIKHQPMVEEGVLSRIVLIEKVTQGHPDAIVKKMESVTHI